MCVCVCVCVCVYIYIYEGEKEQSQRINCKVVENTRTNTVSKDLISLMYKELKILIEKWINDLNRKFTNKRYKNDLNI